MGTAWRCEGGWPSHALPYQLPRMTNSTIRIDQTLTPNAVASLPGRGWWRPGQGRPCVITAAARQLQPSLSAGRGLSDAQNEARFGRCRPAPAMATTIMSCRWLVGLDRTHVPELSDVKHAFRREVTEPDLASSTMLGRI